jgi:hypothetical protein
MLTTPSRLRERVRRRIVLERDIRRLRAAHGDAFAGPECDADGPVALVVSLTEFVYQLKLEGLLGKALQLKGWRPVVLVPAGSWIPPRYLRVLGIDSFAVLDDYLDDAARSEAHGEADRILASQPSAAGLSELTFHGAAIGRQVLSTASRALHRGAVDPSAPDVREKLAELLPRTLASTIAAERALDDLRPGLVLFLERNYAAEAPLSDLALTRGINVIQFVSGFQDDALVFKRYTRETRRLHPRSLSAESWRLVQAMPWGERQERELDDDLAARYGTTSALARRIQGWTHEWPRGEVLGSLGLDPARRTAVVYSHILWDANMFYGEDLFADQEEWLVQTVRAACANEHVNWIVKLHPATLWKLKREGLAGELDEERALRRRIGLLPAHIALLRPESDVSTRSVFDLTDVGITIRGSIGFELPCLGVPVLTAGTGYYAGRGFTIDSATPEEYLGRLAAIEAIPPLTPEEVELARRHAFGLFRLRSVRFPSFQATIRPLRQMGHPLDHDVAIRIGTREELERAADLRRFADWAVDSQELDYLAAADARLDGPPQAAVRPR